ncbi:hypothetical protein F5Y08DRAFT_238288 [Xylaria arbuscula]|nr:hypothetical protein F5Y08DRAFT_238288 [Xylaria arbuscula]
MDLSLVNDCVVSPPLEPTDLLSSPSPSTFLNLPLEIRLEIYTHLLTTSQDPSHPLSPAEPSPSSSSSSASSSPSSSVSSSSSSPAPFFNPQTAPTPLHPNILRTCRQLHAECIPVLYKRNIFTAHATLLTVFPSLFNPSHRQKRYAPIRSPQLASLVTRFRVRLRLDAEPQFARDAVTAQFSGKHELLIETWQTEWRGAGPEALRLFEDVRGVRIARVVGSGFEEYARWLEGAMMSEAGDYVAPFPRELGGGGTVKRADRACE